MLYKPTSYTSTNNPGSHSQTFTSAPWYQSSYCVFSQPVQTAFVEVLSGEIYDALGTADSPKRYGQISFSALYSGTKYQIASATQALSGGRGGYGSLRLDVAHTTATARYDTIPVRWIDVGISLPFQVDNLVAMRVNFTFQQVGTLVGTFTP